MGFGVHQGYAYARCSDQTGIVRLLDVLRLATMPAKGIYLYEGRKKGSALTHLAAAAEVSLRWGFAQRGSRRLPSMALGRPHPPRDHRC